MNSFFELIQIAIGDRHSFDVAPSDGEWQELLNLAEEQALTGVLLEAIEKLPKEQLPPRDIRRQWLGMQSKIISKNTVMNARAAELTSLLAEAGYGSCVLKGQGTALYYPHPEHRASGDIDIWVEGRRKELLEFLAPNYKFGVQNWHHTPVEFFSDVEVEVHHHPTWLCNPIRDKRLRRYFSEQWPAQSAHSTGQGFNTPTPEFAYIYCLLHIFRHLLDEGVGLRQIMDLYFIGLAMPDNSKRDVQRRIREFGLDKIAAGMMYVLREVFGLPESKFIYAADEKCGRFILDEIMQAGNFGKFDVRNSSLKGGSRALRGLKKFFGRQSRFMKYFPSEVLWIFPWRLWQFFFWRSAHTVRNK